MLVAAALVATAQLAWAYGTRAGHVRHHQSPRHHTQPQHNPQHFKHRDHQRRQHARPLAGIVILPVLVPRRIYYAPVPYSSYTTIYGAPPGPALSQSYAPGSVEYRYYCPDSKLYYPDVLECPSGWLAVVPGVGGPPGPPH